MPAQSGLIKNRGGKKLFNFALTPAAKQAERTNVRAGVARRRVGQASILSMAAVAIAMMSASSAFASSVKSPLLLLSNYTAQDKGVTYSVAFVSPEPLIKGSSKVTLQAPNGTTFGKCKTEICKVIDEPSSGSPRVGSVTKDSVSNEKATITITTPVSVGAGDRVIVHVPGSTNAAAAGGHNFLISTSVEKEAATTTYDLSPRVLISQVRPNGPGGADDSLVELYAGGNSENLTGWTLKAIASGGAQTTLVTFKGQQINNNAAEPDGFLLAAGSGYSLGSYAAADVPLEAAIPANGAVALYDNTNTLVDSVVFGESTGIASTGTLGEYSGSATEQYAFVRKLSQQPGGTTGAPQYTGHNAEDWELVAPEASPFGSTSPLGSDSKLTAVEGAPGPHGLNSSVIENPNITISLLSGKNQHAAPNEQLNKGEISSPNAKVGTLYLRRTITYHGQCTLGNLKLRVSGITTDSNPAPVPSQAILRVLGNPSTSEGGFSLTPTTLDNPPSSGADGGGLNSSLSLPGAELNSGESLSVGIKLGVQKKGGYKFFFNVEGSTVGYCA